MTFADLQLQLGLARRPLDPKYARTRNLCEQCAKKGIKTKLRLAKDLYTKENYTRYKVEIWACDVCKKLDKRYMRIEGKGKSGANAGGMWGSK